MSTENGEIIVPARAVKAARAGRGLKQTEAAKSLEMPRDRLSAIETGKVWDLRASEIALFERVLGIDPLLWIRAAGRKAESEQVEKLVSYSRSDDAKSYSQAQAQKG